MIEFRDNFIHLASKDYSLIFEIKNYYFEDPFYSKEANKKYVIQRYFGPKIELDDMKPSKTILPPRGSCNDYNKDYLISSTFGIGNNNEPSIIILNSDNSYTNRFFFWSAKKVNNPDIKGPHTRKIFETLDIVELDEESNIELHHYYSLCEDSNIFICKKEIINKGKDDIQIRRIMSLEFPILSHNLKISTYDGEWLKERYRHDLTIYNGVFINQSLIGTSSHKHNPFIEITDLNTNLIYFFNLIYSGNHKEMVEVNPLSHSSVFIGINDFAFDYTLKQNESFMTPESIFSVAKNENEVIYENHKFILNHIVNPLFAYKDRPILFNSWEGSVFNINENNLLEMADLCKDAGIELFVIDDGWFKNRVNEYKAIGDWEVDPIKFPLGLSATAEKIRQKGLKFGFWVEPENISPDSDLFRLHPEYALISNKRHPLEKRHQYSIDMTNPNVVNHLFNCLSKLFDEIHPDYVKWDYNRFITDMYSISGVKAGEFFYKYINGTYDLLDRLTNKYPDILFEGCSSGGGRFDLGLTYFMPQHWGSDNSNSFSRIKISTGTFIGYPISTFGAHVSKDICDENPISSLEDRFNINAFGAFGYEFDIREFNQSDLDIIKSQNEYYKRHRHLIQYGELKMIINNFDDPRYSSFEVINNDKSEAILFVSEISIKSPKRSWRFIDLDADATYCVEVRKQANIDEIDNCLRSGKDLMEIGLDLGKLSNTKDCNYYPNGIFSRLIYIRKV